MRRIVTVLLLMLGSIAARAQYAEPAYDISKLSFDETALRSVPEAWTAYQDYADFTSRADTRSKIYRSVSYVGVGVMAFGVIPLLNYDSSNSNDCSKTVGVTACSIGAAMTAGGAIANAVVRHRSKSRKRDFVTYLSATQNGLGIVTDF